MYGVAYQHPEGFGSVGFLGNFQRGGKRIRVGDPVFGWLTVDTENCFAVIETEGGSVLPAVAPVLSSTVVSPWLLERAEEEALVANTDKVESIWLTGKDTGEKFPSGYPLAWRFIERWRTEVAPDWRTIALAAMFARISIQRPIEEAEMLYRQFGPIIRDMLLADNVPGRTEMRQMAGIVGTRAGRAKGGGLDDVRSFQEIFEWAPWVGERMQVSEDYDRTFRDMVAVEKVPWGLATAKLSFTMMLCGRDASCLDTRMEQYFFGDNDKKRRAFQKASSRRSRTEGSEGLTPQAVRMYRTVEDRLSETEFFDPEWPMPFAKAQWMLWETLGRTAGPADHSSLWEVVEPMLDAVPRKHAGAEAPF